MKTIINPARARLEAGEVSVGVGLRVTRTVDIAKAMKTAGYDWLFIDLEHSPISITIGENHPYEPLEGMFVVRNDSDLQLTVVAVLGLRRDRDGFSQITVSATVADMVAAVATRREPPFGPVMDGGCEAGFLSVISEGELLHLTHLALLSATE